MHNIVILSKQTTNSVIARNSFIWTVICYQDSIPKILKVRQSCDGKTSLTCTSNSLCRCLHFYFCVLCDTSLFWDLSTNDANATRTSLCVRCGKQAKQTQFQTNADMPAAHTTHHNNTDGDGNKRVAYREFGVHLSLTTVTEKAVRWHSRSLRHLPLEQLKHWRRSSTNRRQLSASSPACTAAPRHLWTNPCAEMRKCSCVVNGKLHVFTG